MSISVAVFLLFVIATLGITYWAARRSHGASAYFAAGRKISAPGPRERSSTADREPQPLHRITADKIAGF